MQVAGLVLFEVGLWLGCFREDGLGREGGLMKMISFMKVVWSFLRWSDEVGHEAHGGGEGWVGGGGGVTQECKWCGEAVS